MFGFSLLELLLWVAQTAILAIPLYFFLRMFRNTRIWRAVGLVLIALFATLFLSRRLRMDEIAWITERVFAFLPLALLVLFHNELRHLFLEMVNPLLVRNRIDADKADTLADQFTRALEKLSASHTGAIIAFERVDPLDSQTTAGVRIDAAASSELLTTLFHEGTSLHDGGVIIREGRIAWAGCVFPLSSSEERMPWGTRHRAALGLSEQFDALVVVVSEESGLVSIAWKGTIRRGVDLDALRETLRLLLSTGATEEDLSKSIAETSRDVWPVRTAPRAATPAPAAAVPSQEKGA